MKNKNKDKHVSAAPPPAAPDPDVATEQIGEGTGEENVAIEGTLGEPSELVVTDGDDLADKLEAQELDEKRPLCEVTKRKGGLDKLATHRVWRTDGTIELTCIDEIGPASTWLRMEELK
jgi:hypothetical protein